jgi:hypothetical protein
MGLYHARLSPSSSSRWTDCTASPAAQDGLPNSGSDASRKGTTCHQIGAECLENPARNPSDYAGRKYQFYADGREAWQDDPAAPDEMAAYTVEVTDELVEITTAYVNFVRNLHATHGGEMFIETSVPIGHITGEEGASGSSDCAIHAGDTFFSIDLKAGRGRVKAYDVIEEAGTDDLGMPTAPVLRMNTQLAMYTLGGIEKHGLLGKVKHIKGIIVQPALNAVSEYSCTIEELLALGEWLKERAEATRSNPEFKPNDDNCFFCKARMHCGARNAEAMKHAVEGFDEVTPVGIISAPMREVPLLMLGTMYSKVSFIRKWCDDIEERVKAELEADRPVLRDDGVGYKLVAGRPGTRSWADEAEAEAELLRMLRNKSLIYKPRQIVSPADAEKMAAKKRVKKGEKPIEAPLGPTQWARLQELIIQPDGKPVVAIETDPRPKWEPPSDGFDEVPPVADNSDLFY